MVWTDCSDSKDGTEPMPSQAHKPVASRRRDTQQVRELTR